MAASLLNQGDSCQSGTKHADAYACALELHMLVLIHGAHTHSHTHTAAYTINVEVQYVYAYVVWIAIQYMAKVYVCTPAYVFKPLRTYMYMRICALYLYVMCMYM